MSALHNSASIVGVCWTRTTVYTFLSRQFQFCFVLTSPLREVECDDKLWGERYEEDHVKQATWSTILMWMYYLRSYCWRHQRTVGVPTKTLNFCQEWMSWNDRERLDWIATSCLPITPSSSIDVSLPQSISIVNRLIVFAMIPPNVCDQLAERLTRMASCVSGKVIPHCLSFVYGVDE